ncbi:hypothetical protein GFH48_16635 [Streptomyces fagopyri]|uniref:Uncharacterized protein n=1 Tax=Streptomyces fagopyri TaxID=2662397 RepID=A0A5Q0LDB1_9ACTN|nr:hypothetical protein [Streptomyces fagopyri]QFZ74676.1 hypothetical protein GFH48_16635 [Streptomyces fagopyri]
MSLVDLIAQADERGLAVSGLACLDRCVPLLGGDDEVLRPLWSSLADGGAWGEYLEQARTELDVVDPGRAAAVDDDDDDEAAVLVRRMLAAAPDDPSAPDLREWADACSVGALRIHRLLDAAAGDTGTCPVSAHREGLTDGISPLVAAELRRQVTVLELLAGRGAGGLRPALEVSTEGRRVLRAVVSRRARGRS